MPFPSPSDSETLQIPAGDSGEPLDQPRGTIVEENRFRNRGHASGQSIEDPRVLFANYIPKTFFVKAETLRHVGW